jgi:hypothetical protein
VKRSAQDDDFVGELGAESKDLGEPLFTDAARSFSTTEARQQGPLQYQLGKNRAHEVVKKLQAAWAIKHRRGPSTPRYKRLCNAMGCEALRSG